VKGINNRQKTIVKPRENVQKYLVQRKTFRSSLPPIEGSRSGGDLCVKTSSGDWLIVDLTLPHHTPLLRACRHSPIVCASF